MSEKTKEVPQPDDLTYAHNLVIKSTHEYKVHNFPLPSWNQCREVRDFSREVITLTDSGFSDITV